MFVLGVCRPAEGEEPGGAPRIKSGGHDHPRSLLRSGTGDEKRLPPWPATPGECQTARPQTHRAVVRHHRTHGPQVAWSLSTGRPCQLAGSLSGWSSSVSQNSGGPGSAVPRVARNSADLWRASAPPRMRSPRGPLRARTHLAPTGLAGKTPPPISTPTRPGA